MNSSGSAMKENETYVNSLQGHLSQLNSAWQELSVNTVNSDLVKWLLDVGTGIVKITNNAGGLVPVLTTISGLIIMFKADKIVSRFSKIGDSVKSVYNGFKILKQHLLGAKNAEVIYMDATTAATTATNLFTLSVGSLIAVFSIAIQIYNAIKQARKEATEAAIKGAQESQKEAENAKEQIKEGEKKIKALEAERDAYLKNAKAQDEASDNSEYLKAKQDEIDKTQENIDKLREEQKERTRSAVIGVSDISTGEVKGSVTQPTTWENFSESNLFPGIQGFINIFKNSGVSDILEDMNERLETAKGNIGTYNQALKNEKTTLEASIATKKANNESYDDENKALEAVNSRINEISEDYNNAEKKAKIFYDALKTGLDPKDIGLSEDDVKWMQEFYGLTDAQITLLKQGQDVERETIKTNTDLGVSEEYIKGVLAEQLEVQEAWRKELEYTKENIKSLNTEIDNMQSAYGTLSSAIDEYNSSGTLSINTLQSLLSLNGDYLNALELVNGKLQISQEYEDAHKQILQKDTLALIENAAMEDLKAQATGSAGQVAEAAGEKIKNAGLDGKTAGEYASQGVAGFTSLAGAMAQAGMVDLDKVDVTAWANKWAGITETVTSMVSGMSLSSDKFISSSNKTSKASKSAQSEYKATIDTLYKYSNAVDIAKNRVSNLNKELSNTDNLEEQEKITRQLINALNDQIQKTNELKDAQTSQINDYINQLRQQGFAIDYNNQTNELYINNMEHLADFSGDTAKNLEKLIKKIQSLNSDNVSLDSSVRDLTNNTKKYYDQLADYPEKKLKQFQDLMKDFQQSQLDQVQDQIDDIQHAMEQDPQLKALKEQLEAMEAQTDEKDKQAELEEKMLAVEKAREALENAKRQKTLQVYRENLGWVYETDPDEIANAQKDLLDAEKDLEDTRNDQAKEALEKQIEDLEKSYQDQIDKLQDFLDEQNYQIDKANRSAVQSFEELAAAMKKYGIDSAENLAKAKEWLDSYNKSLAEAKNNITTLARSGDGVLYSSDLQGITASAIDTANYSGISLSGIKYTPAGTTNNSSVYNIDRLELPNVTNANEFIEALKSLPTLATAQATSRK